MDEEVKITNITELRDYIQRCINAGQTQEEILKRLNKDFLDKILGFSS